MCESERIASMQVRGDVLLVNLGLQLVGNKNHDDVSFLGSLVLEHDLQASFFSLSPALGAFAQANATSTPESMRLSAWAWPCEP